MSSVSSRRRNSVAVRPQYLRARTIVLIGCVLLLSVMGNTQLPSCQSERKSSKTLGEHQVNINRRLSSSAIWMDQPWTDQLWPETSAPPVAPRQEGTPEPKSPPQEPSQEDTGADNSLVGKPAPDFELRMVLREQTKLKLSDLQGKAVLLNFWASWCEPCKFEMPWFEEFQQKYGEQGFQVIGIALEDHGHEEAAAEFADKAGVHYPILVGTDAVAELYGGVDGLPQTFFIDRTGTIVAHEIGLESMSTIEANIKKVLAEKLDVGQCGSK